MTISHLAHDTPIIIVGGGPVGMLIAYQLEGLGLPCVLVEQNLHTTHWPKLDLTNCRSMEILRMSGLADEYRAQEGSVGDDAGFITHWVSKLDGKGHLIGAWVSAHRIWERNLVLVRPDTHVAWRGDRVPEEKEKIVGIPACRSGSTGI